MSLALIPGIPTLGPTELIIALVVILLLFGAKRIPELARGLGSGVREFKAGTKEGQLEDKQDKEKNDDKPASEVRDDETKLEEDDATVKAEKAEQNRS
ncbi:MAG: Twin-arginine translocation protein TatA [uncultured Rubrobacteraceae bacterium]|uniref:Sec-independent protein translocase protein TatA n=1 Tax=uncultured Rubrobacteraceae bacterium TaxID=349277 RepID=A0A6J4RW07_9ACTN|nr:MAG: Twin-arginine translocation protein TatA [uncultured Rubrobacteraceae bacterium]